MYLTRDVLVVYVFSASTIELMLETNSVIEFFSYLFLNSLVSGTTLVNSTWPTVQKVMQLIRGDKPKVRNCNASNNI